MLGFDCIGNNFVLIFRILVSINLLQASTIYKLIAGAFKIFIRDFKAEFARLLNRYITNYLKKIVEREKVIAFIWKLTKLVRDAIIKRRDRIIGGLKLYKSYL
jgi:hypothetical protein